MQDDDTMGPHVPARTALEMDERGVYKVRNQADEMRIAEFLIRTKAVPQAFREPSQVMMAMQACKSLGLNPYTALRQCSFVNGAFTLFGDLELAVVRATGELEGIDEFLYVIEEGKYARRCFENGNLHLPVAGAVCRIKRKGLDWHESTFSREDANHAGLWGKTPTWRAYPGRMMQMRARGQAIRNTFSDATQGVATHEYDVEGITRGSAAQAAVPNTQSATERVLRSLDKQPPIQNLEKE
jgi:hypothetical protein